VGVSYIKINYQNTKNNIIIIYHKDGEVGDKNGSKKDRVHVQSVWQEGNTVRVYGETAAWEMPKEGKWETTFVDGKSKI